MADEHHLDEIELEFLASWDWIEHFYTPDDFESYPWLKPISDVIAELRRRGYDRKLRPGHSLEMLILSRSCEHGLRKDQATISFLLRDYGGMWVRYWDNGLKTELNLEHVEITPEVDALLQRLLEKPIN